MPQDFESTEIAAQGDFTLVSREKKIGEEQASETFKATSNGTRPLGEDGEMTGIAKRELGDFRLDLQRQRALAEARAEERLMEIREAMQKKLDANPDMAPADREALEKGIKYIDTKTSRAPLDLPGRMDIGGYGFSLPGHENEPELDKLVKLQRQLRSQINTVNTVQPLINRTLVDMDHVDVENLNLLSRAVGSSEVDQLLGTNVLAREKFGLDSNGRPVGISVGVDGVGVIGELKNGKPYFLEVDYSSHSIQKGLYDLEALDYITGQIDRHAGNIFIDPATGQVRGIDNDLAFPQMSREDMLSNPGNGEMLGKPVINKPLFMHEDTARKIESLRPDELRRALSRVEYPGGEGRGRLSPEEIEGAVTRLQELQQHVKELRQNGHIVKEFNKETYNEAVTHQEDAYAEQMSKKQSMKGKDPSLNVSDRWNLDHAKKTSYIGAITVERRKNELGLRTDGAERLDFDGIKAANETTGKTLRSPQHEEFSRIAREKKQVLRNQLEHEHKPESDRLQARLYDCEKRLAKLEKPGFWERFRALRYGGVEGAKQAFDEKRVGVLREIRQFDRKLDETANLRLEGEKENLWERARRTVESRAPRHSDDLKVEVSQSLPVEGFPEKQPELVPSLEKQPTVQEVLHQAKLAPQVKSELDGHETDESPKVDGEESDLTPELGRQDLTDESLKGEEPDLESGLGQQDLERPGLDRKPSVRDMMRENQVVKRAKAQLGLEQDEREVGKKMNPKVQ